MDRSPFQLSSPFPVTCNGGKGPLEKLLREGCSCGGVSATLTQRKQIDGKIVAALQCDNCGAAKSNGLQKKHFPGFDSLPLFDSDFQERYWREQAGRQSKQIQEKQEAERIEWQRQYDEFLQSREWYNLRAKVIQRDRSICQACGEIKNQHYLLRVHHLSYEFGFMPPLWMLQTVCVQCHDRLHADKHGFADPWCPPSIPLTSQ
jgi:hypothetical protein